MLKSTQEMRGNVTRVQARQDWSLGLCTGDGVRCFTDTFCFFRYPHCTIFCSKGTPEKIKLFFSVLKTGNSVVAAKLCLEGAYLPPLQG